MADEFSINANIELNTSDFQNGLSQAQDAIRDFQDGIEGMSESIAGAEESEREGSEGLKGWGIDLEQFTSKGSNFLKGFGFDVDKLAGKFGINGTLLAGIVACTVALGKMGMAMDEATSEIVKGTGATGQALRSLEASMQDALINGVGMPLQEMGGVMADLNTRFGVTGETLTQMTDDIDQFSSITGTDARGAVEDLADIMKKWKVETGSANALMNQLAKASQDSGASVQSLTADLKSAKSTLAQFGMDLTESTAFLANLKKNGIESSTVLTAMRTGLAKFATEGKEPKQAMADLAEAIKNAGSQTEALQLATEAFGARGGAEMVEVFRSGAFEVEEYAEALNHAGDTLEKTDEASRTVKDAMDDLKATFMGAFGQFGQAISSVVKNIIDVVQSILSYLAPVFNAIGGVIRTIVSGIGDNIAKIISYVLDLAKRMNMGGGTITKILNGIGSVFSFVFGTIAKITKTFYTLIVVTINKIKIALLNIEKIIAPILQPVIEKITDFINTILTGVNWLLGKIRDIARKVGAEDLVPDDVGYLMVEPLAGRLQAIEAEQDGLKKENERLLNELKEGKKESELAYTEDAYEDQSNLIDGMMDGTTEFVYATGEATKKLADLSKYEDKLLSQALNRLAVEKMNDVNRAKNRGASLEEIEAIEKDYDERILAIKKEQIERERKAELESVKDTENAKEAELKINEYYDNEIANLTIERVEEIKRIVDDRYKLEAEWADKIHEQKKTALDYEEEMLLSLAKTQEEKDVISLDYARKRHEIAMQEIEAQRQASIVQANGVEELIEQINSYYDLQAQMEKGRMEMQELSFRNRKEGEEEATEEGVKGWQKWMKKAKEAIESVKKHFSKIADVVKKVMSKAVDITKKTLKGVVNIFSKLFDFDDDAMLDSLLEWEDKVLTFFVENAQKIPAFVASVLQSIRVLTENILGSLSSGELRDALGEMVGVIATELPVIVENIAGIVSQIVGALVDGLKGNVKQIVGAVVSVVKVIISYLPEILPVIAEGLVVLIEGLIDALVELFDDSDAVDRLTDSLAEVIQKVFESGAKNLPKFVKILVKAIVAVIKALVKAVGKIVKDTDWGGVWNEFKDVGLEFVKGIWDGIKGFGSWLWTNIKSFFSGIWDWISGFFSDLWGKIKGAIDELISKIKQPFENVGDTFSNIGSGIKGFFGKVGSGIKNFFGFADGTQSAPQGLAMVGEEGPELVRFRGGEQVINNRNTQKLLADRGNGGSTFNVTFNNLQDTTAFAMMKQMKGWQRSLAFNAVM